MNSKEKELLNGVLFTPSGAAKVIVYLYDALKGEKINITYEEYQEHLIFSSIPEERKQLFFFAGDYDSELICDIPKNVSFNERILAFDFVCWEYDLKGPIVKNLNKITHNKLFYSRTTFDYFKEIAECFNYLAGIQIENKLLTDEELVEYAKAFVNQKGYKKALENN